MTLTTTSQRNEYPGTGSVGPFAYNFRIFAASDLVVEVTDDVAGIITELEYPADYAVSGVGNIGGGSVTLTTAISADETVVIRRVRPLTQTTSFRSQAGRFLPEVHEDTFDHLMMVSQQLQEQLDRSLKLPVTMTPGAASGVLPLPTAGQALFWNAAGTAIENRGLDGGAVALPGAGRVVATLTDYLANNAVANVKDFGAKGDGVTDDSACIQAAIDTGLPTYFPAGTYRAHGLTQSTAGQSISGLGGQAAVIQKNADGDLLTSSASDVHLLHLQFRGDAAAPIYSGHNLVFTGDRCAFINCGSIWAAGRALKATGGHVTILGTNNAYQTADTSAAGYDIEIGSAGVATLYHDLISVVTSQATGGILLIDTGSHKILGGQIGKLYIQNSGANPAGINGGSTLGCRIIGTTIVEQSSAVFSSNQHAADVTFAAGTSNCRWDGSNVLEGGRTVTNLGTQNLIVNGANDGLQETTGRIPVQPNNVPVRFRKADGTAGAGATPRLQASSSDNLTIANDVADKAITLQTAGASSFVNVVINSVAKLFVRPDGLHVGGSTAPLIDSGTGSPEGVKTAPVGSLYLRSDGGAATSLYVKESGTGNTGWIAK